MAERTSPGMAMAVMATISVAVTLLLAPGLRPDRTPRLPDRPGDLPAPNRSPRARGAAAQ
jgi:hypothetical protein